MKSIPTLPPPRTGGGATAGAGGRPKPTILPRGVGRGCRCSLASSTGHHLPAQTPAPRTLSPLLLFPLNVPPVLPPALQVRHGGWRLIVNCPNAAPTTASGVIPAAKTTTSKCRPCCCPAACLPTTSALQRSHHGSPLYEEPRSPVHECDPPTQLMKCWRELHGRLTELTRWLVLQCCANKIKSME